MEVDVEEPIAMEDAPPSDGGSGSGVADKTPEELVAKAIAPVKREFLRPPPIRPCSNDANDVGSGARSAPPSSLLKEKKSKRQLKRERLQVLSLSLSHYHTHSVCRLHKNQLIGYCLDWLDT